MLFLKSVTQWKSSSTMFYILSNYHVCQKLRQFHSLRLKILAVNDSFYFWNPFDPVRCRFRPHRVKWLKVDDDVPSHAVVTGDDLFIENLNKSYNGTYRCVASNTLGESFDDYILYVYGKFSWKLFHLYLHVHHSVSHFIFLPFCFTNNINSLRPAFQSWTINETTYWLMQVGDRFVFIKNIKKSFLLSE